MVITHNSQVSSSGRSGDLDSDEEGDNDDDDDDDDEDICSLPPIYPGPMGCLAFVPKWTYSKRSAGSATGKIGC